MHLDLGQTTDGGTEVTSKMTLSGPVLGFLFRF
jgi:hypothetical protein